MVTKKNNVGDKPNSFVSETGSPFMDTFSGELQKDGSVKLTKTGVRNVYEEIQSFKDSVDINKIVERYRAGDINVLNQIQGAYMDLTEAPKNIFEAMQKIEKGKMVFDRLDPRIKERFGNDFVAWASSAGEESWFKNMDVTEKEVKEVGEKVES